MTTLTALFVFCLFATVKARPSFLSNSPVVTLGNFGSNQHIIGGVDARPGAWPWQLSQQIRSAAGAWSHTCGASLLSSTKALGAAHCVDGRLASNLRVIAGLHQLSSTSGSQISAVTRYVMHERYELDAAASASNDIAILYLDTPITVGGNVQLLSLPRSNDLSFSGTTCTITGWGRVSSSNAASNTLQQADITVITTSDCQRRIQGVNNAFVWDSQVCIYDSSNQRGACNGDSGGPLNCPDGSGGYYVAGVASWVVSNILGNCLTSYPSVYTRTSSYVSWIENN